MDYVNTYRYGSNGNPYALNSIVDTKNGITYKFHWDSKGNMIAQDDDKTRIQRYLCWTEDNRLQAVKDNEMGAYYNYDASGERNLKLTGGTINITQNGQSIYAPVLDQQTLYASALVTVNDRGYTKHYFEEGKRICSKIGSGELKNISNLSTLIYNRPPQGVTLPGTDTNSLKYRYGNEIEAQRQGVLKTYEECIHIHPFVKNKDLFKTTILPYSKKVNSGEPVFYYHSDHIGSASYISDSSGIQTQQLVYLPFGEDWVDKKYNNPQFQTPYKFNGKEKDEETGYNNFGARYYTDWASIWLSVDPMSDKYPHLTSYNYCANNPVMLVDPDGRMASKPSTHIDQDGNVVAVFNDGDNGVYQHGRNADGSTVTESQLSRRAETQGTSSGGTKVGETAHWDEFVSPETGKTMTNYKLQLGKSFDPIISNMHSKAEDMDLIDISMASKGGGLFDIKKDYPNVGGLLNGKYATSRSAGNFLAGYNAESGTFLGIGISFTTFQKLAGALHIEESNGMRLSKGQMLDIVTLGTYKSSDISKFKAPTYGECKYQHRMSEAGWNYGSKK